MEFEFKIFLTKKPHPNTVKLPENFKTPQIKIFSITVDFRVFYEMLSSITINFKWVFKIHVWIKVNMLFYYKSPVEYTPPWYIGGWQVINPRGDIKLQVKDPYTYLSEDEVGLQRMGWILVCQTLISVLAWYSTSSPSGDSLAMKVIYAVTPMLILITALTIWSSVTILFYNFFL